MGIENSDGYKKLIQSVERDEVKSPNFHDYRKKLQWIIDRAEHYSKITGIGSSEILNTWESQRDYWYMNYYQDCNQPLLTNPNVRIFENEKELHESVSENKFRCLSCGGVSTSPYECNSGKEMSKGKICNWKSYGLFGTMGKGTFIFLKEKMKGENIFTPVSWEK